MRWSAGALAAGGLAVGLLVAAPGSVQADERIGTYRVRLQIEPSGDVLVSERISYDFGPEPRHGILRDLPVRRRFDDRRDRLYRVRVLGVDPVASILPEVKAKQPALARRRHAHWWARGAAPQPTQPPRTAEGSLWNEVPCPGAVVSGNHVVDPLDLAARCSCDASGQVLHVPTQSRIGRGRGADLRRLSGVKLA